MCKWDAPMGPLSPIFHASNIPTHEISSSDSLNTSVSLFLVVLTSLHAGSTTSTNFLNSAVSPRCVLAWSMYSLVKTAAYASLATPSLKRRTLPLSFRVICRRGRGSEDGGSREGGEGGVVGKEGVGNRQQREEGGSGRGSDERRVRKGVERDSVV